MPATIASTCRRCGREVLLHVGASGRSGALRSWSSYRCTGCGDAVEADGTGPLPPAVREALLLAEGASALMVEEQGERAMRAVVLLRGLLGMTPGEAVGLSRAIPGVVFRGCSAECEWLAAAFAREKLRAAIRPAD